MKGYTVNSLEFTLFIFLQLLFATIEIPHANECIYDIIMYGMLVQSGFLIDLFPADTGKVVMATLEAY